MRSSNAPLVALPFAILAVSTTAHAAPPLAHHVCPNGLEVVVAESHAAPLVTVEVAVHEGAMTEDVPFNGLSHLYEHMFFKGNAAQPDQLAYLARLRALGMDFNGTTDNERVNYYFTTTSDHLGDALSFMRDAIATPLFDAKELERERVVVTGEIDRNESEPSYHLWHTIEQELFWKYPTRKDALGRRASVLAATTDMMRTIQKRYYVPNNAILVVAGDAKADDVFAQADRTFGAWAQSEDPFKKLPLPEHPPLKASKAVLVAQPVENVTAILTWQGPSTVSLERAGHLRGGPAERRGHRSGLALPEGARRLGRLRGRRLRVLDTAPHGRGGGGARGHAGQGGRLPRRGCPRVAAACAGRTTSTKRRGRAPCTASR